MKILLDLQGAQTESRLRGIGRQTRSFADAIIRNSRGHDIHILLNQRLHDVRQELVDYYSALVTPANVHLFEVPGATAERDSANLWRAHAAELLREEKIASIQPDIVHIGSLFEGYVDDAVVSIGRLANRCPTAVTLHDVIPIMDPDRYLREEGPRRHWLRKAQQLKRADLLLAVSAYSKMEAERWLHIPGERIAVISAGVEPGFRPNQDAFRAAAVREKYRLDQPFLLYVGAVDPRKNVELIFEAFARLPAATQEARLIAFVGRLFDEEIDRLRIAAAKHGVSASRLRFCQHVSEADLIALYGECDMFVFPSVLEGYGLPVAEAMACGAPVLAADAASLPAVVGNRDLMFDPFDGGSLAAKIEQMINDRNFRQQAIAWGTERAAGLRWDDVATRAIDAMEAVVAEKEPASRPVPPLSRRPRLAFLSPLPSDRSGIADYSAELLPELGRYYDIECVVSNDTNVTDEWILSNYPVRSQAYFEKNHESYDRIVYSIGNSHFHAHMVEMQRRYPGVAIFHDFFLSDLIDWMSNSGVQPYDNYFRELYRSHGLTALLFERRKGRRAAVAHYPTSGSVFDAARGVIVHSRYAVEAARQFYGDAAASAMTVVPHLRALSPGAERAAARKRLGVAPDDLLLCSFGVMTARKRSRELLAAWQASEASRRPGARLVFVGENLKSDYGDALRREIAESGLDIDVTGFAEPALYRDYLAAADIAVQLRGESRGETSGTILDCLAARLPVIVNAHGPAAEIPASAVRSLPDEFTLDQLVEAIDDLAGSPARRLDQARRGLAHVEAAHQPARVGRQMFDAIEQFYEASPVETLVREIGELTTRLPYDLDDFRRVASILSRRRPQRRQRQLLYDVTVLSEEDSKTGIQRVVRGIMNQLIENPPAGYRLEPIRIQGNEFRYAHRFVAETMDIPAAVVEDEPIEYDVGDIYLAIDWVPDRLPQVRGELEAMRVAGTKIVIGVHDLLPFRLPEYFPNFMPDVTRRWFETALGVADQFVCVSAAVADDVIQFGNALGDGGRTIAVDFFHNAADIAGSLPSRGRPKDASALLERLGTARTFLMVGTLEPRKGHSQVLGAFEQLWREGSDINLVIVGKLGWMTDDLAERIKKSKEHGRRLFWLNGISDEFLDDIYARSAALIAASAGEGFGLPLIEAARHGTPLIARDIPVFREVAGEYAYYFTATSPEGLARSIAEWIALDEAGGAPQSAGMPYQSWRESACQLWSRIHAEDHHGLIGSDPVSGKQG